MFHKPQQMSGGSAQPPDLSHGPVPPPRGGQGSPGCGDHIQGVHPLRPRTLATAMHGSPRPRKRNRDSCSSWRRSKWKVRAHVRPRCPFQSNHSAPHLKRGTEHAGPALPRFLCAPARVAAGAGCTFWPARRRHDRKQRRGKKKSLFGLEAEPLRCVNSSSPGVTLSAQTPDLHRQEFPGQRPVCTRCLTAPQTAGGL